MSKEEENSQISTLDNSSAFNHRSLKFGLPIQMFVLLAFINGFALVLTIKFLSIVAALGFILFFLLTTIPVYLIHSQDNDAWRVWIKAIFTKRDLLNDKTTIRKVIFINLNK